MLTPTNETSVNTFEITKRHSNLVIARTISKLITSQRTLKSLKERLENPETSDYMKGVLSRELREVARSISVHQTTIKRYQKTLRTRGRK